MIEYRKKGFGCQGKLILIPPDFDKSNILNLYRFLIICIFKEMPEE